MYLSQIKKVFVLLFQAAGGEHKATSPFSSYSENVFIQSNKRIQSWEGYAKQRGGPQGTSSFGEKGKQVLHLVTRNQQLFALIGNNFLALCYNKVMAHRLICCWQFVLRLVFQESTAVWLNKKRIGLLLAPQWTWSHGDGIKKKLACPVFTSKIKWGFCLKIPNASRT